MLNIGLILQTRSKCKGSPRTRPKGTELGLQAAGPGHLRMTGVPAPPPRSFLHRARSLSWMDTFPKCPLPGPRGIMAQPLNIPYGVPLE